MTEHTKYGQLNLYHSQPCNIITAVSHVMMMMMMMVIMIKNKNGRRVTWDTHFCTARRARLDVRLALNLALLITNY